MMHDISAVVVVAIVVGASDRVRGRRRNGWMYGMEEINLGVHNEGEIKPIFGQPILHDPNFPKCNNHLVSFIKVEGLFVPYIVHIFDTIKSRT